MDISEVKNVEKELITLKSELEVDLSFLFKEKIRGNEGLTPELNNQSIIIQNDEVIDDLDKIKLAELKDVDHALFRIKSGLYDICEVCSEKIDAKRLLALPYTSKCLSCCDAARE
jgi:RNA polymerase-binding transcription factor DksA